MRILKHPNILSLVDFIVDREEMIIVTELMQMNLINFINKKQKYKNLTESELKKIFMLIAQAIQHMHANDFIHRDLKPENILVKTEFGGSIRDLKVGDLGLSCSLNEV